MGNQSPIDTATVRRISAFWIGTAAVCGSYLAIELVYLRRLPLVMDEFQGAHAVHQLTDGLPYRDFRPYKTVLGYYIQLPALLVSNDPWTALVSVKLQAAVLTALALALAAWALQRHFRRSAVLLALMLLVAMSTFLERSAELRVDMLTSIAGLASLLLLLNRRAGWAGVACGVSLVISQKGAYYAIAGVAALAARWFLFDRTQSAFLAAIRFSMAIAATLLVYIGFWSALSSATAVVDATFVAPRSIAFDQIYDIRLWGWQQTLKHNPMYYALVVSALLALVERCRSREAPYRESLLLTYGLVMVILCVWHKQPWPYFFVLLIPTLFVLHVALFDLEIARHERARTRPSPVFVGLIIAFGLYFPLRRVPVVLGRDAGIQRTTVRVADAILGPADTYLAGVHLLFDRQQAVPELSWLDQRRSAELRALGPEKLRAISAALAEAPMKLCVQNYRLDAMPPPLREQLDDGFSHLWANVFVYAPRIGPSRDRFDLKFSGKYVVQNDGHETRIDDRVVADGDTLTLERGTHRVITTGRFRLQFWPEGFTANADPRYRNANDFFPNVYSY